ncbi:unnamed protein product, partial [Ascophyllum nodosum]
SQEQIPRGRRGHCLVNPKGASTGPAQAFHGPRGQSRLPLLVKKACHFPSHQATWRHDFSCR